MTALNITRTKTCERCKKETHLAEMKFYPIDKERNIFICQKCYQELKGTRDPKINQRTMETEPRTVRSKIMPAGITSKEENRINKVNLFCDRCSYKFSIDQNKMAIFKSIQCPYCGKTDKVKRQGNTL